MGIKLQRLMCLMRFPVSKIPCLRLAEDLGGSEESSSGLRRLQILREEFRRANRRAAGPFSHPFATRGSLSKLREQIRDVSRVSDAVLLNAEFTNGLRLNELCNDLKGLLQTQEHWTDRLENQIWRIESQSSLMKRLKNLLLNRSPANEELWGICQIIAQQTQALPSGLMLLPEPGHRLIMADDSESAAPSWAIEHARLAVFAAITMLPEVRGADIVAQTLHAAAPKMLTHMGQSQHDSVFTQPHWLNRAAISDPAPDMRQLIKVAGHLLSAAETHSATAADTIVPASIKEFFGQISTIMQTHSVISETDVSKIDALCTAIGLTVAQNSNTQDMNSTVDDSAIVLTHKLRWHAGSETESGFRPSKNSGRPRRPHFSAAGLSTASLSVFSRED